MGVIIYSFNLNISPKICGVLECDIIVTELRANNFVIEDFVIKKGLICVRPCTSIGLHWNGEWAVFPEASF